MPKYVRVHRVGVNVYRVMSESYSVLLYSGGREAVHSWLCQYDYKQDRLVGDLEGSYKRA